VLAHHTTGAKWHVSLRRFNETARGGAPALPGALHPAPAGREARLVLVAPQEPVSKEMHELLEHKRPYLNLGFFAVRAVIYFACWTIFAWLLRAWSLRQDETGDLSLTVRNAASVAGGVDAVHPHLHVRCVRLADVAASPPGYSTIFGLYVYAGAFVASLAALALIVTGVRSSGSPLAAVISEDQQHKRRQAALRLHRLLGLHGLLQYMLIWAGNLPEEVQWIVVRSRGVWRPVGILILLGHFVLPFFVLLSRDVKRSAPALAAVAAWMLVIHYVDVYWVVMPAAEASRLGLHWTHFTAFVARRDLGRLRARALPRRAARSSRDPSWKTR